MSKCLVQIWQVHIYNSIHCRKISNLFVRALETGNAARLRVIYPFHSEYKWIWYFSVMYVYCFYPAILKKCRNGRFWFQNRWNRSNNSSFHRTRPYLKTFSNGYRSNVFGSLIMCWDTGYYTKYHFALFVTPLFA